MRRRLYRLLRWSAAVLALLVAALLLAIYLVPLPAGLADRPSTVVEYRDGEVASVFLSPDDKWRLPVDLDRVDPAFIAALVALEDRRFWSHPGVDPIALARALGQNLRHGRRVSGGSTLAMQLARLLEPRPRTLSSKLIEVFRAVQLDARLDKRAILAAYLTRAPYGENLEGVEAASLAYFGHRAAHLSPAEIATLLAVPQGPARLSPSPANRERLRQRRDAILAKLIAAGAFPADADRAAPVPESLRRFPREAEHASRWLASLHPDRRVIRSTLDGGAQRLVERQLAMAQGGLAARGIHNGAVVVVDPATREVLALVGNLDDADGAHGGDIAMFDRPRSPGSALKPFLYALAIDRGLALPDHLVADVPSVYGSYRPRNFDGRFAGLVTLRDALSRSLNLPFVDLLARFGVERFLGELGRMGVASPRAAPGSYGLSLIAGGIEVTPLELAGLYATLAGGGVARPLRMTADDRAGEPVAVFGEGAAWLTREALSLRDRPDFPRRRLGAVPPEIHWKTGTSFGYRDAWAAGSGPTRTAVVWLGNVDNRATRELTGTEAAAPVLFDLLEALERSPVARPPAAPPPDLGWVEVCAYSGRLATDACPRRQQVLAPIHSLPVETCPFHRSYQVDAATGEAWTPGCRPGGAASGERRSFLVLPSRVTRWLDEQHQPLPPAPRFAAGCAPAGHDRPVRILSPTPGATVLLLPGVPASKQEIFFHADTTAASVSWFVDGELLRTVPARERLYWTPVAGRHEIVVVDEAGGKDRLSIEVRQ